MLLIRLSILLLTSLAHIVLCVSAAGDNQSNSLREEIAAFYSSQKDELHELSDEAIDFLADMWSHLLSRNSSDNGTKEYHAVDLNYSGVMVCDCLNDKFGIVAQDVHDNLSKKNAEVISVSWGNRTYPKQ